MQLGKKLSRSSRRKYVPKNPDVIRSFMPPEIYISIDELPVWYWWEIERTGNVKLISKKGSKSKLYKYLFYCSSVWDDMNDQHIKEFGIPRDYTETSIARANVAIAKAKYAVSQSNWD